MITFKQYNLDKKYIDIVATFDKDSDGQYEASGHDGGKGKNKEDLWSNLTQEKRDQFNKERSIIRTKTKVRRLVISQKLKYMWTLTFAEAVQYDDEGKIVFDAGNLDHVWLAWKAFLKRCTRAGIKMKYVVTVELQEKRLAKYKEKVYHFHFATDVFIPFDKEAATRNKLDFWMKDNLWDMGFSLVSSGKRQGKFAHLYLMKYITKMFDESVKGSHRYRCARGMKIDVTKKQMESELMLDLYVNDLAKSKGCSYKKEYYALNDGDIEILVYILIPYTTNLNKKGKKNNVNVSKSSISSTRQKTS